MSAKLMLMPAPNALCACPSRWLDVLIAARMQRLWTPRDPLTQANTDPRHRPKNWHQTGTSMFDAN